jgi:hypothetical protein
LPRRAGGAVTVSGKLLDPDEVAGVASGGGVEDPTVWNPSSAPVAAIGLLGTLRLVLPAGAGLRGGTDGPMVGASVEDTLLAGAPSIVAPPEGS